MMIPQNCNDCTLCESRRKVVQPIINQDSKVLFLMDTPDSYEDIYGRPLIGASTVTFTHLLKSVGLGHYVNGVVVDGFNAVNIVGCKPPVRNKKTIKPKKDQFNACQRYVDKVINDVQPKLIVTFGATAFSKFVPNGSLVDYRGVIMGNDHYGCKVLPTFSPLHAFVSKTKTVEKQLRLDMMKLKGMIDHNFRYPYRPGVYKVVRNMEQFDWVMHNLNRHKVWSTDLETTGFDWEHDDIFLYAFSWLDRTGIVVDNRMDYFKANAQYCHDKLREVYDNESRKIFQNGAFDIKFLLHRGMPVRNYFADTMHMHHAIDENKDYDLVQIAHDYTPYIDYDRELSSWIARYKKQHKLKKDDDVKYNVIPDDIIHPYAAQDADVTLMAFNKMVPMIRQQGLDHTVFNITMPMQRVLIRTEYNGVNIDTVLLRDIEKKLKAELTKQEKTIWRHTAIQGFEKTKSEELRNKLYKHYVGAKTLSKRFDTFDKYVESRGGAKIFRYRFNPGSTKDMRELLFDVLKIKPIKFTKDLKTRRYTKNPSVDSDVLTIYAKKHELCAVLSRYGKLDHLMTSFVKNINDRLRKNKLHTSYLLPGTVTGRPSSRNPNLNNIPRSGTVEGFNLKNIYIAEPGWWLVQGDGAQLEFRTWGGMSGDERMIRDIELGLDIHSAMGGVVKGRSLPSIGDITDDQFEALTFDVTKDERQNAKHNVVFGPIYGRSEKAVAQELDVTEKEAGRILNELFKRYPTAKQFLNDQVKLARQYGYVRCLHGRRRRLPAINSDDSFNAERQAYNAPIQGTASDITFKAAIRIQKRIRELGLKSRLVLTVYDSIVYHTPEQELETISRIMSEEFVKPPTDGAVMPFNVPLKVDISIGKRWGNMLEDIDVGGDWSLVMSKLYDLIKGDRLGIVHEKYMKAA